MSERDHTPSQSFPLAGSTTNQEASQDASGSQLMLRAPVFSAPELLATKLFVPRPRPHMVARPRLLRSLDRALSVPLMLITAPASAGKTTLLAEWLASRSSKCSVLSSELPQIGQTQNSKLKTQNFRVAWLSLDAGDNDPATFLRYLIAALQGI